MVGLESSMDQAEAAKKTKQPKIDAAEEERQKKFYEQLRKLFKTCAGMLKAGMSKKENQPHLPYI